MRLAFFSPLNPQKSGISDYTEELLPALAARAAIDLFVDGFRPTNAEVVARFRLFDYRRDPSALSRLGEYDAVIYHMGNDHRYHEGIYRAAQAHPGHIVFHDFALQDFFLGLARTRGEINIYLDEVEACQGREARAAAEEALGRGSVPAHVAAPTSFPLNQRLARAAEAIIVHSEWSRSRFEKIAPGVPVARINMGVKPPAPAGAGKSELTIATFGLITPGKGIERALGALAALRSEGHAFHYTLVGEPNPFFDVREAVRACGMNDHVTITGHVSLEEFERRITATDIAINLRERTVGETSASLCRIMAAGVPAIVSNVGWFAELPGNAVVRIDPDEMADALLYAYLKRLIEDARLRAAIGANARRYALEEHAIERSAESYLSFIRETVGGRARRRFVSAVSAEVSLLGIDAAEDEQLLRGVAAEVAALAPAHIFDGDTVSRSSGVTSATAIKEATERTLPTAPPSNGRLRKIEGIDYKRAAIEYLRKLSAERHHYLLTKPFYNLANDPPTNKPPVHKGDGIDEETHRHFCDFVNIAAALALPAGRKILDVGCGSGWLCEYFARLGYDVTGIDISADLIAMSRERVGRVPYGADHQTPLRCHFKTHDIESAPLDETFDAIVCYDSLHHFEDERAVIRHLAAMLDYGGLLFILEGDKPPEGSATEEELLDVMRRYETLESPFSREYLRALLVEHGLAVIGDYLSVNGLFERDLVEGGKLDVEPAEVNYLLCKKVAVGASAANVPDSSRPGNLSARITVNGAWPERFAPGERIKISLTVENTGDTLWLVGAATLRGSAMLGVRLFDAADNLVSESHGIPPLPRALAPGESATLSLQCEAPENPGRYKLKLDLVAQHVCWFEQRGSRPLVLPLQVMPS